MHEEGRALCKLGPDAIAHGLDDIGHGWKLGHGSVEMFKGTQHVDYLSIEVSEVFHECTEHVLNRHLSVGEGFQKLLKRC